MARGSAALPAALYIWHAAQLQCCGFPSMSWMRLHLIPVGSYYRQRQQTCQQWHTVEGVASSMPLPEDSVNASAKGGKCRCEACHVSVL
eukprot:1148494-Pelagomonas_calceolata.AAC.1